MLSDVCGVLGDVCGVLGDVCGMLSICSCFTSCVSIQPVGNKVKPLILHTVLTVDVCLEWPMGGGCS